MSKTKKLTVSALVAAACVAVLFLSTLLPRVTLAITALAGLFPAVVVILCGYGWALGAAVTAIVLGLLLLPDKTVAIWFACFFGHYPVWKAAIEKLQTQRGKPLLGWTLKLAGFWACFVVLYVFFDTFFASALPAALTGNLWLGLTLAALTAAFLAYDVAFSILIGYFRIRILPRIH